MAEARYDGLADWYDSAFAGPGPARETVLRLLGDGPGSLLDIGCCRGWFVIQATRLLRSSW